MVDEAASGRDARVDALREGTTMALYVSIVLLAALAALPAGTGGHDGPATNEGVHGLELLGIIWGARRVALVFGSTAVVAGMAVASVKNVLAGH